MFFPRTRFALSLLGLLIAASALLRADDRWQIMRADDDGKLSVLDHDVLQAIAGKLGVGHFIVTARTTSQVAKFFRANASQSASPPVGWLLLAPPAAPRWLAAEPAAELAAADSSQAKPDRVETDTHVEFWSVTEIPVWQPTKRYQFRFAIAALQNDPRRKYDLGVELLADPTPGAQAQGRRLVQEAADAGYIDARKLVADLARGAPRTASDRERDRPER